MPSALDSSGAHQNEKLKDAKMDVMSEFCVHHVAKKHQDRQMYGKWSERRKWN